MENHGPKSKNFFYFLIAAFIFSFLVFYFWPRGNSTDTNALDVFAQCLRGKGAIMYGANWCGHCQNEKKAFGDSFKFIPYVECPEDPKRCLAAGISGYPTWIFSDGKRLEGEQGVEKLSQESGCPLTDGKPRPYFTKQ